jgi:LuxR family maltose regulon positive regulatory protein
LSLPLLFTKFNLPATGQKTIPRLRLHRILDRGLEADTALMLVCGPAGYGKTTLVGDWLQTVHGRDSTQVAWLTLEQGDDDLTRFLTYFVTALQRLHPGFGEALLKMLRTHKPPPVTTLATLLVNEINTLPQRFLFVLDDYHLITNTAIHNFLNFLIDHEPPQLCLLLITRTDPPLPLPRLRARGQLVELRQKELCFTASETARFLDQTMGLSLSTEHVALLADQTEGWISGLQLAALSMRDVADQAAFIQAFSGEHEFIADYLTNEVMARLPESLQTFLLQTSILERLSAPLCQAVTGQPDAQAMLERLIDDNLFILPLDSQHTWYRYHNLFADLLRKRLLASGADLLTGLHQRASLWFEQNNLPDLAIQHAIAGRNYEQATRLIQGLAEGLLSVGQAATLLRWLEALPAEQLLTQPSLGSLYGIACILSARPIRLVADLVDKMTASSQTGDFQGEMNMLRALLAVYQGQAERVVELSELALTQLPSERSFFRCLVADALGMGHTLQWDLPAAKRAFAMVADLAAQHDNIMLYILALTNLAGLSYIQGHLRSAIATCHQILDTVSQRIGSHVPITSKTLLTLGEMLREQGDLQAALNYLQESARMMEEFSEIGLPIVNVALARIYLYLSEEQTAQSYIDRARRYAQNTQTVLMDDRLVEVTQARLYLARGELGQVESWARGLGFFDRSPAEVFTQASRNPGFYEVFQAECMALVRLLLAQSQPERALEFVSLLQTGAEKRHNQRRLLEVLVLNALALHQLGQLDQALQTLDRALDMAEPEGFLRTFVDEGAAIARLLQQALQCGLHPAYIARLLATLAGESWTVQTIPPTSSGALVEPLSPRELEVLCLVAEGLSNAEIAQRLYISLSTVKGHTTNIFGKLGVSSRTQAVVRARQLGLLASQPPSA